MDSTLKYRIVGATVLLSLAVIFIPMILDGSGQESVTKIDMEMPPEPTLVFSDELDSQVQTPAPEHTYSGQDTTASHQDTDAANNIVPEVVVSADTKSELLSWVVQVGAFGEKTKALAMQKQLVDAGYDALVEVGSNNGKDYYRVKVGPVISQDEATKIRDSLRKKMKLEAAFVTRHPRTAG
ncbi:MAG: SPOR domain-containing protein [Gammaproteobacteria bacterium]|nr:SPOR domain-containing protein [Gammaproteobacteria bacterium]